MSFRLRVATASGVAVLFTIVLTSVAFYFGVRHHLYDQVDASLSKISAVPGPHALGVLEQTLERGMPRGTTKPAQQAYLQFVDGDGRVVARVSPALLPITAVVRSVALGRRQHAFFNASVDGSSLRVYVFHLDRTTAVEVGQSLGALTSVLHDLVVVSAVVTPAGVVLAVLLGGVVAFASLRPVRRLSAAARAVAETGELSHRVEVRGHDELGEVAAGFNAMLDTLAGSLRRQRQLVADASHVLRTPLATVRTNVEVLRRADELDADDRAQLIHDTVGQLAELTRLVDNLIELARGDEELSAFGEIRLDEVMSGVVAEAKRYYPSIEFKLSRDVSTVWGSPDRLAKALGNVVDNAAKWTRPGTPVEVVVRSRTITVRDHGPGVDAADAPHIFDRFYRSLSAKRVPGSGLGLAIAKQAVEAHGGQITVSNASEGGAEFVINFPEPPGR